MADTKISLETTAGTLTGTELIPAVQVGANVKFTPNALINDLEICTYNASTNAIEYPPGTPIIDLDAGGATDASQYVLMTADAALPNSRVMTSSTSNTISTAVAGQVQIQSAALTGDVTAAANSNATTIANGAVTDAKMANMPPNSVKTNNSSISAAPANVALSTNQVLLRGSADIAAHTLRRNLRVVGTNLDSGQDLYYGFKTAVSPANPNANYFRFDTTDVNTITTLRVNVTDLDSVSQAVRINLLKIGDRLVVMSTVNPFTVVSVWAVTAGPLQVVDAVNGDYYNIGVDHVAGVIPTTSLEPCEIKHFPAGSSATITEAAILDAGNFPRLADNGAGGYHMLDNLGSIIESVASVYALPGITISGVPTLPAANTVPTGTSVILHKDNFVGQGSTTVGVRVIADPTNNLWRPDGHQVLFSSQFGSVASPSLTLAAPGRYNVGVDPKIPAGLFYAGARVRFSTQFYSLNATATTGPTARIFIGDDLVTYTNNSTVFSSALAAANLAGAQTDTLLRFITGTTGVSSRAQIRGGGGGTGGITDVVDTNSNLVAANQMMVTYDLSAMGTATGLHLLDYQIIWEG